MLNENQAWLEAGQLIKDGHYVFVCNAISDLWREKMISLELHDKMKKQVQTFLKAHCDSSVTFFGTVLDSPEHRAFRVKFCKDQVNLAGKFIRFINKFWSELWVTLF